MRLKAIVTVGYKDIFDDYEKADIQQLLRDVPTKNALEIMGYFLAQLHSVVRSRDKQLAFLKMWLKRLPTFIHQRINSFAEIATASPNAELSFINNISALILIETLLENENQMPLAPDLTPEQELNLFKAYLWCSQQWIDKQYGNMVFKQKALTEEDAIRVLLPSQLPYYEITETKDFAWQFIKAMYFFHFCEENAHFKIYLETFLKEYKLNSWEEYLTHFAKFYFPMAQNLTKPSVMSIPNEIQDAIQFAEDLCIDAKTIKKSDDFIAIREKPVYRIDRNNFLFLNFNFLLDKIFQGIQFDFARVLIKAKATYKGDVIKMYPDFKSIYGSEFSESGLFYSVMGYAFEKSGYVKFKGNEMRPILKEGEPDYYMRDKAKVYLFEFKDILISAEIKHSHNYERIVEELLKKLVKNKKDSPKGATQLVNAIEKMRNKEFNKFDNFNFDDAIIYPVIVFTDFSLNMVGINFLLNQAFRNLLHEKNISRSENIKDLVLVDLDTFIKFQDMFRRKSIKLNNCLNEYYKHTQDPKIMSNHISSFEMFVEDKLASIKYEYPKMLLEEILKVLPIE